MLEEKYDNPRPQAWGLEGLSGCACNVTQWFIYLKVESITILGLETFQASRQMVPCEDCWYLYQLAMMKSNFGKVIRFKLLIMHMLGKQATDLLIESWSMLTRESKLISFLFNIFKEDCYNNIIVPTLLKSCSIYFVILNAILISFYHAPVVHILFLFLLFLSFPHSSNMELFRECDENMMCLNPKITKKGMSCRIVSL